VRNGRTQFFDERSVTEDFATSFLLQTHGWGTDYVNHRYAVGMGPETLPAYFTQQMRWAMGTEWQIRPIIKTLLKTPKVLTPAQWWEYWMVSTYYFVGYAHFIFMLAPIMFMLFDVRPVRSNSTLYLAFFVPYVLSSLNLFFFGMRLRGYGAKGVWLASALSFSSFWIYMKAGAVAVLGLKRAFGVTPKGFGGAIPVRQLWVELTMLIGSAAVSLWALFHIVVLGQMSIAYFVNGIWATYHGILLSTLFLHFNKPVTIKERQQLFESADTAAFAA
jgi:cellulose synthase (UDP-forming)